MDPIEFDGFHADIFADSVGNMHHIVAGLQFGIVGDPPGLTGPAAALQLESSLDFLFGDHGDPVLRQFKAGRQVPGRHEHAGFVDRIGPRHRLRLDSLLQKAFPQYGRRLKIGHQDQNPIAPFLPGQKVSNKKLRISVIGRNAARNQIMGTWVA